MPPIVHDIVNKTIDNLIQTEIRPFRKEMDDFAIVVADQFARVDKRFDMLETRIDNVESRIDNVETRLGAVESKLDGALLVLNNHENRTSTLEDTSRRMQAKLKLS